MGDSRLRHCLNPNILYLPGVSCDNKASYVQAYTCPYFKSIYTAPNETWIMENGLYRIETAYPFPAGTWRPDCYENPISEIVPNGYTAKVRDRGGWHCNRGVRNDVSIKLRNTECPY